MEMLAVEIADDLDIVRRREKEVQPAADHSMIVNNQHANHTWCRHPAPPCARVPSVSCQIMHSSVPAPGRLSTRSVAPMLAARSRMMPRPSDPGATALGSNPRPSSVIRSSTRSGSQRPVLVTWLASACLAMLLSDSWVTL